MLAPPKLTSDALLNTQEKKQTSLIPERFSKKKILTATILLALSSTLLGSTLLITQTQTTSDKTYEAGEILYPQKYISSSDASPADLSNREFNFTVEVIEPEPEVKPGMIASTDLEAYANDVHWDVQYPFPVGVPISSPYGPRAPMCDGCRDFHAGTDFAVAAGTPIQPIAAGRVLAVGNEGDYGYRVIIEHEINGIYIKTKYGHLITDSSTLKPGDIVKRGDQIGLVGSTGLSTGNHLHLEIAINGTETVDPLKWLKENAGPATVKKYDATTPETEPEQ